MEQLPLPNMHNPNEAVNISKVSHLSPFRYPGGKTWLVPTIRFWLHSIKTVPKHFIEPFAGGGIVGLTIAFEELAEHVTLVELDEQVAAVWQIIIEDNQGEWLGQQIVDFELTVDNVHNLLKKSKPSRREKALQTIVRNRVNRGGILAMGAGMLKAGENGRGISSRWYPETLQRRIREISKRKANLSFIFGDGFDLIQQHRDEADTVFFVDPPYTAFDKRPGSRLYNHSDLDHDALFKLMAQVRGNFIMTYNNDTGVIRLAEKHNLQYKTITMKNTHHAKKKELVIGKDLSWFD